MSRPKNETARFDTIVEVEKNLDCIIEVEKVNPYHDRLGRFTFAPGGGASYVSGNPKEKECATSMVKPKDNMVKGLGKEHAEAVEKLVQNSSEETRAVWDKYADEIIIDRTDAARGKCSAVDGAIEIDLEYEAEGSYKSPPYEGVMHECGHSIDYAITRKVGYRYSERYNAGEYEQTLIKEANDYIKKHQKELSSERGQKVSIAEARKHLAEKFVNESTKDENAQAYSDVSDMLQGATKGKFDGPSGHSKDYWIGKMSPVGRIGAHSVSAEAFAEMFSASTANPQSLAKIKEVFPDSYNVFRKMIKEAAEYE